MRKFFWNFSTYVVILRTFVSVEDSHGERHDIFRNITRWTKHVRKIVWHDTWPPPPSPSTCTTPTQQTFSDEAPMNCRGVNAAALPPPPESAYSSCDGGYIIWNVKWKERVLTIVFSYKRFSCVLVVVCPAIINEYYQQVFPAVFRVSSWKTISIRHSMNLNKCDVSVSKLNSRLSFCAVWGHKNEP